MRPVRLGAAWWAVVTGVVVGLLVVLFGSFRVGGYIVAGALVAAAAARSMLPSHVVQGIAIRARMLDVFFYLAAAAAIVVIFSEVRLGSAF